MCSYIVEKARMNGSAKGPSGWMRIDTANPKSADRDRFLLSKGHAAPVLYSVMAERGYSETPKDKLNTLRQYGSMLLTVMPAIAALTTSTLGQPNSLRSAAS